ncbi:hypothetical protein NE237_016089 [Protea cynaroides]|uniref:Integrase catalytic domain-containing protein n=1 Tax=Protea cynaroides TaxID=273540 RepID=A0A9Q0QRQ1_9MAGN|nr:hypothetical protein NE237_016089 [Protea cynaroides]
MVIGVGMLHDGLYYFEPTVVSSPTIALSVSSKVWHFGLGHPSPHSVHIPSCHSYTGFCDVCPLAKHTRSPFPNSVSQTVVPFELVHCDILGPYSTPSHSRCHYFLTIVDDCTRTTWVFLMQNKSETLAMLSNFFILVSNQFSGSIKTIRTDNGSEFLSLSMQQLFQSLGIVHQLTCVYTPQQNGVVEHKHRHILQVARSLRFQAKLPLKFWGECILTACYIINRLPTPLLSGKSPYEMFFHKSPSYDHFHVFGSLCYARNHSPLRDKFSPQSTPCIFVGYPMNQKGYRVYDLSSNVIFTCRDVQFFKHIFPFHLSTSVLSPVSDFGVSHLVIPTVTSDINVEFPSTGPPIRSDNSVVHSDNNAVHLFHNVTSDPSASPITHTDISDAHITPAITVSPLTAHGISAPNVSVPIVHDSTTCITSRAPMPTVSTDAFYDAPPTITEPTVRRSARLHRPNSQL